MTILILLFCAGIVIYLSSLNWRISVKIVLVLLIFEGVLRKWVLPQASDAIYLLKDVILTGAYLSYFLANRPPFKLKNSYTETLNLLLFISAIWCAVQSFNPDLGSFIVGLFGLSRYLLYIPLMWLVPSLFDSEEELYKFLRLYLLLVIPVCLLGIAQFYSPPSSPLNVYAGGAEATANNNFGGLDNVTRTRITGTFSYTNIYTAYLFVSFSYLLSFIFFETSPIWKITALLECFLIVLNFFMTGSRGIFIFSGLFFFGYLSLQSLFYPGAFMRFFKKLTIPILIIFIAAPIWFKPAIDALNQRVDNTNDAQERIILAFTIPSELLKGKSFIDSYGTGATHTGGQAIRRLLNLPQGIATPPAESELHRVAIELGYFGFTLWYAMRLTLLLALWNVFQKLKRAFLQDMALTAFLYHLILLPAQIVVHPVSVVYYWFFSGFIFLLPRLESLANFHNSQLEKSHFSSESTHA